MSWLLCVLNVDGNLAIVNLDVCDLDVYKGKDSADADWDTVIVDADVVGKGVDDAKVEVETVVTIPLFISELIRSANVSVGVTPPLGGLHKLLEII